MILDCELEEFCNTTKDLKKFYGILEREGIDDPATMVEYGLIAYPGYCDDENKRW